MKKIIGKIASALLLAFAGVLAGEILAGLKEYGGDLTSFVLSSLQADILMLFGIVIFLLLCVLGRQKEILKHQKEQLEVSCELQMLLKNIEREDFTKESEKNVSAPDKPYHTERLEKRDES